MRLAAHIRHRRVKQPCCAVRRLRRPQPLRVAACDSCRTQLSHTARGCPAQARAGLSGCAPSPAGFHPSPTGTAPAARERATPRPCAAHTSARAPRWRGSPVPCSARLAGEGNGAKAPPVPLCPVRCGPGHGGRVLRAVLAAQPVGATCCAFSRAVAARPASPARQPRKRGRSGRFAGPSLCHLSLQLEMPLRGTGLQARQLTRPTDRREP